MLKSLLLVLLVAARAWASEQLETASFSEVASRARSLGARYQPREVLLVLDIDNTLLRANQDLGSDQWFEWQSEAIKAGSGEAAFATFEALLKAQAHFFQLGSMSLTEAHLPLLLAGLQRTGFPTVLLTSRSPDLRNVTERELRRQGLWFDETSPVRGVAGDFKVLPFKAPVSLMNGIFMTAGHHKGEALQYLLRRSGKRYKAIVFVDDHVRHTQRVSESLSALAGTEVITYRYSKEDPRVKAFKEGPKAQVLRQGRELLTLAQKIFKEVPRSSSP